MSCERSSGGARAANPSSRLGGSSSTCSSSTCLSSTYSLESDPRKALKIFGGWTKKSIRGS